MPRVLCVLLCVFAIVAASAQSRKLVTDAACAGELGTGVKTRRVFCEAIVGTAPAEGVMLQIPAHTGTAMLQFDLHNRYYFPADAKSGPEFARMVAVVAVVRPNGQVIERAVVQTELRSEADVFDRIETPGGVKATAPGQAEPVRVTIPAGIASVGIVGVRVEVTDRSGRFVYDAPGRPVAVISNWRIQYTPR